MQLIEYSQYAQSRQEPALASFHNAQKESKEEKDDKRWHQVRLPDEASVNKRLGRRSIEQCSNATGQGSIVAARKEIGEHSCHSRTYPDKYCTPNGIGREEGNGHKEIDGSWGVSDTNRSCITRSRQQTVMHSILSHAKKHRLVFVKFSSGNLVKTQKTSDGCD